MGVSRRINEIVREFDGKGAGGNDKGVKQNMLRSLNAAFNSGVLPFFVRAC